MVYPVVFSSSELGWLEIKCTMGIFVLGCLNAVLLLLNPGIVVLCAFIPPLCNPPVGITCTFSSSEVWDSIAWGWFKHPGHRGGGVCGPWALLLQLRLSSGFHGSDGGSAGGTGVCWAGKASAAPALMKGAAGTSCLRFFPHSKGSGTSFWMFYIC